MKRRAAVAVAPRLLGGGLEEEGGGGGDSTDTRRKACLRLEEEVAEACGNDLRGLCFRRGIRGGLRRRFEGFVFPERNQRGPAATF